MFFLVCSAIKVHFSHAMIFLLVYYTLQFLSLDYIHVSPVQTCFNSCICFVDYLNVRVGEGNVKVGKLFVRIADGIDRSFQMETVAFSSCS